MDIQVEVLVEATHVPVEVLAHITEASTTAVLVPTTTAIAITTASVHADHAIAGTTTIATTAGAGEHPLLLPTVPGAHALFGTIVPLFQLDTATMFRHLLSLAF